MSLEEKYNTKSPAVKRLMREAQELHEATDEYHACPLEDNLFEWHFTVKGPPSSEFEGGVYHGRIILPPDYPMKPPNIILLTPNGRFEVHKKICLSISGHHPETWQPSWSIRTALLALIAFMPTPGNDTIGALDYSEEERQKLAKKSQSWKCEICGSIIDLLAKDGPSKFDRLNPGRVLDAPTSNKAEESPPISTVLPTVNSDINQVLRQRLIDSKQENSSNSVRPTQLTAPSTTEFLWSILQIGLMLAIILLAIRRVLFTN